MTRTRPFLIAVIAATTTWVQFGVQAQAQSPDQPTGRASPSRTTWIDRPFTLSIQEQPAEEPPPDDPDALFYESETTTTTESDGPAPILWDGFIWGDRHFQSRPRPIGSPLYFEDPFINTDLRAWYVWHKFPRKSPLGGGDMSIWAVQARLALTDRLQFTATEDGYTKMHTAILKDAEGWNDLALGLKYAVWVDHESDFIVSTGLRWRLSNGHGNILQGNVDELSPYVTAYKGWGKWGFMADVVGRLAMDRGDGNHIVSWDLHVDYELFENFYPLLEFHALHYVSNGDRLPLDVGGLDYSNIGSNDVAGHTALWGTVGFHWNITKNVSWSAGWGFPLQSRSNNDLFDQRATSQIHITF